MKRVNHRDVCCARKRNECEQEPCVLVCRACTAFHWVETHKVQKQGELKYQLCISTFVACTFRFVSFVCLVLVMETNYTRKTIEYLAVWNCSFLSLYPFFYSYSLYLCVQIQNSILISVFFFLWKEWLFSWRLTACDSIVNVLRDYCTSNSHSIWWNLLVMVKRNK